MIIKLQSARQAWPAEEMKAREAETRTLAA